MSDGPRRERLIAVAGDVASALSSGDAVVALETTVVTHGLPPPSGVAAVSDMAAAVKEAGAVPALVGVIGGRAVVGLDDAELAELARAAPVKVNPGNLASVLASGGAGSTTVAATALLAHRAGIEVLATGGIGGVHRGVAATWDVSADLDALARWPVAVVCSGAKAVLDLPRTREALETRGVPVLGYRTDRFPAFYRRDSGLFVDGTHEDLDELAAAVRAHLALVGTGVLVVNPVPEEDELPEEIHRGALDAALAEGEAVGLRGRDVTPHLLARLAELTGGRSVACNRALLVSNARLAGALAVALPRPRSAV